MVPTHTEFLDMIERHLERSGTSATEFGRSVIGDPNFVFDLRKGRSPTLSTARFIENAIELANGFKR